MLPFSQMQPVQLNHVHQSWQDHRQPCSGTCIGVQDLTADKVAAWTKAGYQLIAEVMHGHYITVRHTSSCCGSVCWQSTVTHGCCTHTWLLSTQILSEHRLHQGLNWCLPEATRLITCLKRLLKHGLGQEVCSCTDNNGFFYSLDDT